MNGKRNFCHDDLRAGFPGNEVESVATGVVFVVGDEKFVAGLELK